MRSLFSFAGGTQRAWRQVGVGEIARLRDLGPRLIEDWSFHQRSLARASGINVAIAALAPILGHYILGLPIPVIIVALILDAFVVLACDWLRYLKVPFLTVRAMEILEDDLRTTSIATQVLANGGQLPVRIKDNSHDGPRSLRTALIYEPCIWYAFFAVVVGITFHLYGAAIPLSGWLLFALMALLHGLHTSLLATRALKDDALVAQLVPQNGDLTIVLAASGMASVLILFLARGDPNLASDLVFFGPYAAITLGVAVAWRLVMRSRLQRIRRFLALRSLPGGSANPG